MNLITATCAVGAGTWPGSPASPASINFISWTTVSQGLWHALQAPQPLWHGLALTAAAAAVAAVGALLRWAPWRPRRKDYGIRYLYAAGSVMIFGAGLITPPWLGAMSLVAALALPPAAERLILRRKAAGR